jgi:hypothetical protein
VVPFDSAGASRGNLQSQVGTPRLWKMIIRSLLMLKKKVIRGKFLAMYPRKMTKHQIQQEIKISLLKGTDV